MEEKKSLVARLLTAISLICFRRPILSSAFCWTLCALSLALGHAQLKLKMDWTQLFYPDDKIVLRGLLSREKFTLPGDIVVLVDKGTAAERRAFIDLLASRLQAEPALFHHLFYRFDLKPLSTKALYYLDNESLRQMANALETIRKGSPTGAGGTGGAGKRVILKLLSDLDAALRTRGRAVYVPIWEVLAKEEAGQTANYLGSLMKGERYVYLTIGEERINILATKAGTRGNEFAKASPMIIRLREILADLTPSAGSLRIRLTGLPVMLHDERETIAKDGTRSTIISLVLVVFVFAAGFGEMGRPVQATLALACGMGWTVGFTTLAVGHLNFISVTLATMLIGVGIDFGIHFIFRYDEEMGNGRTPEEAIAETLAGTGVDTLVGATATATAFLALTFAQFRGISDFGIIAAGGTLLCFLSTITVLPALLSLFPGRARRKAGTSATVAWIEKTLLSNASRVVLVWVLLAVAAGFYATRVGFSYNLLEIQAQEISTVRTELEMIRESRASVLSAEAIDRNLEAAREKFDRYSALPTVARVGSIVPLLPKRDEKKQALVEEIVAKVAAVKLPERIHLESAEDLLAVEHRVKELEEALPTGSTDPDVEKAIETLRDDVEGMDPGPIQDGLSIFQEQVRQDLSRTLSFLKKQEAVAPVLEDLPEEMRIRYVSPDGYVRQMVQPVKNIWKKENLEEFLGELHTIDTEVMGHPVIQEAILSSFHRTLDRTPWVTLLGVFLVFSIYLRSPKAILLSLLPATLAVLMIFALLGLLGMDFNVLSFVGLPISVGLGAVYGVHSLHRMRELKDETVLTTSTGPALLLSGVTDIVGFASLTIAQHRGISSLGFVISVGVGVSFIASLILLPALRRTFRTRAVAKLRRKAAEKKAGRS